MSTPSDSAPVRNYDHLVAALRLPDAEFDAFWQNFLRARPDFVAGATITLTREQLRTLKRLAFAAGREAALAELHLSEGT